MGHRTPFKARRDANHNALISEARKYTPAVFDTSRTGEGFPDFVMAYNGCIYLVEVKDNKKPPSARRLSDAERAFHEVWGQAAPEYVAVVNTKEELRQLIGVEEVNDFEQK